MALWDPEAAGNAAVYLRLDNLKLIDIRNAPFEGRTACWIPYAETGYTKGKKTGKEEVDEKTKVKKIEVERLVDGKMKMFKEEDVEPQNPPKYELLEDMANMTYLSEASVVHNLKSRYELFLIYTVSISYVAHVYVGDQSCIQANFESGFLYIFKLLFNRDF